MEVIFADCLDVDQELPRPTRRNRLGSSLASKVFSRKFIVYRSLSSVVTCINSPSEITEAIR